MSDNASHDVDAKTAARPEEAPRGGGPAWLFAAGLVFATIMAYHPAWHGGFIWDDNYYVTGNPLLTAPDGLWRIWFSLDSPSQYFPLTYTSFYFERHLWGLNTTGYHWVNLLLHAVNALLVWRLLLRLRLPGAWLAAGIFALHPVQVESVAWITERKNVLMAFFYLLSLLAWLKFIEGKVKSRRPFYWLALLFYALALAAKTTACTLPLVLLLVLWLKKLPVNARRLAQVAPFLALGLGMGFVTIWWERFHQGTQGQLFSISWPARFLIASRALWFYAGTLLWPAKLIFSYPRWYISAANPLAYVWLLATVAAGAALWRGREMANRAVAAGVAFFAVTLAPVLGFIMLYTFVYSFVADHYQYVACLGLIALAAAGIELKLRQWAGQAPWLRPLICGGLLAVLGVLTWHQCEMYADVETLWRTTLARNPDSAMAHNNLGNLLVKKGKSAEAIEHLRKGPALNPGNAEAHYNLGNAYLSHGDLSEAISEYGEVLKIQPDYPAVFKNLGLALLRHGDFDEAMVCYQRTMPMSSDPVERWLKLGMDFHRYGHLSEAIGCYRKTLSLNSNLVEAWANLALAELQNKQPGDAVKSWDKALEHNPAQPEVQCNLAMVLATATDPTIRNGAKAVALAEQANQATQGANPVFLRTLAAALAEAGRYPEAASTARKAIGLAQAQKDEKLTAALQAEVKLYDGGSPLREIK